MRTYIPVELARDGLAGDARHDLPVSSLGILVVEDLDGRGGHAGSQQGQAVKLRMEIMDL